MQFYAGLFIIRLSSRRIFEGFLMDALMKVISTCTSWRHRRNGLSFSQKEARFFFRDFCRLRLNALKCEPEPTSQKEIADEIRKDYLCLFSVLEIATEKPRYYKTGSINQ